MRIAFLTSLLVVFLQSYANTPSEQDNILVTYSMEKSKSGLDIQVQPIAHYFVTVERDSTIADSAVPQHIEVIGSVKGKAIILADTYASIPGGMSYCQAGEESFLRIVSIAQNPAKEIFRTKLASCRQNIELASPGVEWLPEALTLRLQWLAGPNPNGAPELQEIKLNREGLPITH